jgi:hypothetical protein
MAGVCVCVRVSECVCMREREREPKKVSRVDWPVQIPLDFKQGRVN